VATAADRCAACGHAQAAATMRTQASAAGQRRFMVSSTQAAQVHGERPALCGATALLASPCPRRPIPGSPGRARGARLGPLLSGITPGAGRPFRGGPAPDFAPTCSTAWAAGWRVGSRGKLVEEDDGVARAQLDAAAVCGATARLADGQRHGYAERLVRTIKEERVDLSDYEDYTIGTEPGPKRLPLLGIVATHK